MTCFVISSTIKLYKVNILETNNIFMMYAIGNFVTEIS